MVEKKTKKPSASAKLPTGDGAASAEKSARKAKAPVKKKEAAHAARKPPRAASEPREENVPLHAPLPPLPLLPPVSRCTR